MFLSDKLKESRVLQYKSGFLVMSVILLILIAIIYFQTLSHEFVFDDERYIVNNPVISKGLTGDGFLWAFTFSDNDNNYWQPLTWISHMLDVELFGMNPAGHHLGNVLLHMLNTLLLMWLLYLYSGNMFVSSIVALFFAIHPLHVESVAWAAERKNLLSCFLGFWTLIFYKHYANKPGLKRFVYVFLLYALCLLAKPALVVLPLLLMLIDVWPLGRMKLYAQKAKGIFQLFVEKVPLFLLSIVSVIVSTVSLRQYGSVFSVFDGTGNSRIENALLYYTQSISEVSLAIRVENALVSYVYYLIKIIWPDNLAVFYPYPEYVPAVKWISALIVLSVITVIAFKKYNSMPYLLFGWLWFLISILPVSGLIQAGMWPAMADRWAYIPSIGIFIVIACWYVYVYDSFVKYKIIVILLGMVMIVLFTTKAYNQTALWKNELTLFGHSIRFAPNSYPMSLNYGKALFNYNKVDESIVYFLKALNVNATGYMAHYNLGNALVKQGKNAEAIYHFKQALNFAPQEEKKYFNLAVALERNNKYQESLYYYKKALLNDPNSSRKVLSLGGLYEKMGNFSEAKALYKKSISLDQKNVRAYNALAILLFKQGDFEESIQVFNVALQIDPTDKVVKDNLEKAISIMKKGS